MQIQHSDLTDYQWQYIKNFFENDRPIKYSIRTIFDAILWITRTGTQWRNLESKYPLWQTVYYYFRKWTSSGVIEQIMNELVALDRLRNKRKKEPSLTAVDSQSVKMISGISIDTGIDGNKKINGRKRHIAVDVEGRLLAVYVGAVNEHDGVAGLELFAKLEQFHRLKLIRGDGAYGGIFAESATLFGWDTDTTQPAPSKDRGFVPQAQRWQVERSFAWLNSYRRLSKDYEKSPRSSEAFLCLSYCNMMLIRLAEK